MSRLLSISSSSEIWDSLRHYSVRIVFNIKIGFLFFRYFSLMTFIHYPLLDKTWSTNTLPSSFEKYNIPMKNLTYFEGLLSSYHLPRFHTFLSSRQTVLSSSTSISNKLLIITLDLLLGMPPFLLMFTSYALPSIKFSSHPTGEGCFIFRLGSFSCATNTLFYELQRTLLRNNEGNNRLRGSRWKREFLFYPFGYWFLRQGITSPILGFVLLAN